MKTSCVLPVVLVGSLALGLFGCGASSEGIQEDATAINEESVKDSSSATNGTSVEEYESKTVGYEQVELQVPVSWSEEQIDIGVIAMSEDGMVSISILGAPVSIEDASAVDALDHPLIVANSAKIAYESFCESNGFPTDVVTEYRLVNGYPCYYTTSAKLDDRSTDEIDVYSDIYVVGFGDCNIFVWALYEEGETDFVSAVLSTLTTAEPASDDFASTASYLNADINPAELYNREQEIIAESQARAQEERNRLSFMEPEIGMTEYEVRNSSWGSPKDINTTITRYGTHEQWVYPNGRYVYFEDGVVTAIQK